MRTSTQATLRSRVCLWQSKVTVLSICRLSVVPLHPAFGPLCCFSIKSRTLRCLSMSPSTHKVNHLYDVFKHVIGAGSNSIIIIIIIIIINDQFAPSGLEAYTGANGSRFKAVHAYWYSFYRPRKDGKLNEL